MSNNKYKFNAVFGQTKVTSNDTNWNLIILEDQTNTIIFSGWITPGFIILSSVS